MNRKSSIVNRQFRWIVVGLVLVAIVLFLPPYDWSFVGDDFVQFGYVWEYMARPLTALNLLNPYTLPWYYRPIQNWWFLTNSFLFDFNPFPYYALLSGFHAIAICLLYRTSRQLRLSPQASLAITALFALHGHWVDVVGWVSSVAIVLAAVFNLAAVSTFLVYLQKVRTRDWRLEIGRFNRQSLITSPYSWLGLTAVFFLLALLTHEESFILPITLLFIKRVMSDEWRVRMTDYGLRMTERLFFITSFVLTAVYLTIQFTRPNLTIEADKIGVAGYLSHMRVGEIGRFVIDTITHLTLWLTLPTLLAGFGVIVAALVIGALAIWFWRGGNLVRLGLLWAGLHLGFIYFALWTQKPELYAGRHIYQASIGLLWAIGAGADGLRRKEQTTSPRKNRLLVTDYGILVLVTAVLITHINIIHRTQASWLERAERYRSAETQVKAILPGVNENTRIYATRFPITPTFLPATFQVWYETTIDRSSGGDLAQLRLDGKADRDAYVFDYQDGDVVNLLPELQAHEETLFLWAADGRVEQISPQISQSLDEDLSPILAGPSDALRLSLVPPETDASSEVWTSLIYLFTVPQDSQLEFSMYTQDVAEFRLRVLGSGADWQTLWESAPKPGETAVTTPNQWTDISIPMNNYWGQAIVIRLETMGNGIWGNPRFTIN